MPLPHQLLYISRLTFLSVDAKTDPRKYKGYSMTDANETWHMYVPKPYRASDPLSIIAAYPFGQIITSCGDLPYATSVPMYVVTTSTGHTELVGHMARNNPHATTLAAGAMTGRRTQTVAIGSALIVVTFLFKSLAAMIDSLSALKWLSPFYYYGQGLSLDENLLFVDTLPLVGGIIVLAIAGLIVFERRDLCT